MTSLIDALGSRLVTTLWLMSAAMRQPVPVRVQARPIRFTLGGR